MAVAVKQTRRYANARPEHSLLLQLRALKPNVPKGLWNWPSYVTPSSLVSKVLLEEVRPRLSAEVTYGSYSEKDPDLGWRDALAVRSAQFMRQTPESQYRRIYTAVNLKSKITYAENVGAWLMAVDLDLDRDTNIPTLPGCRALAHELLLCRAQAADEAATSDDVLPLVCSVIELSNAIVETPELLGQLQDDAPFDCLRPWS